MLSGLNQEIISLYEVSDIESEIEEAETITARIIECQSKIEKSIKSIVEAGHMQFKGFKYRPERAERTRRTRRYIACKDSVTQTGATEVQG